MARIETVACDGCGKYKGEGNHWRVVASSGDLILLAPHQMNVPASFAATYDVCGSACELRLIEKLRTSIEKAMEEA